MSDKTGGQAFPVIGLCGADDESAGMTLRDYFAAKAMQASITCFASPGYATALRTIAKADGNTDVEYLSRMAYEQADAMLKERNK